MGRALGCNIKNEMLLADLLLVLILLQVRVFAQSPFGNQLFWFRETFLQIKLPAPNLGATATKMVATWRVVLVTYNIVTSS